MQVHIELAARNGDAFCLQRRMNPRQQGVTDGAPATRILGPYTDHEPESAIAVVGPLATTRMMCPPDPVGDRLARDVDTLRSYRLQDGRLYLMLPADAGVYVWDRVTP